MTEHASKTHPENGGRIYRISPLLLGSTGCENLGGNLITLLLFRRLKVVLADWLWKVHRSVQPEPEVSEDISPFVDQDRLDYSEKRDDVDSCLDKAEVELPTRSRAEQEPLQRRQNALRYSELLDMAEELKLKFSEILKGEEIPRSISLETLLEKRLEHLTAGTKYASLALNVIKGTYPDFRTDEFRRLAGHVVAEATGLSVRLSKEALGCINATFSKQFENPPLLTVDSIVLSGQSCELPLFRQELERQVRCQSGFASSRTEVHFDKDYAKLATAAGACRGHRLMSMALTNPDNAPEIAAGICTRDLDVRNLFFYLPASFKFLTGEEKIGVTLFKMHSVFRQADFSCVGRVRSEWQDLNSKLYQIYRTVGDSEKGQLWGILDSSELSVELGKPYEAFQPDTEVCFEVTHELELFAMLRKRSGTGVATYASKDPAAPLEASVKVQAELWKKLWGNSEPANGLPFDIFVGEPRAENVPPLIERGSIFNARCRSAMESTPVDALWSASPLPPLTVREHCYNFYAKDPRTGQAVHLAQVEMTPDGNQEGNNRFFFQADLRLMVSSAGVISLICGEEPAYEVTEDTLAWSKDDSLVLRVKLPRHNPPVDAWRDPFSGIH